MKINIKFNIYITKINKKNIIWARTNVEYRNIRSLCFLVGISNPYESKCLS